MVILLPPFGVIHIIKMKISCLMYRRFDACKDLICKKCVIFRFAEFFLPKGESKVVHWN